MEVRAVGAMSLGNDGDGRSSLPELRTCRFCLGTEAEDNVKAGDLGQLISPCSCIGTARWVHTRCLCSWMRAVVERGGNPVHCELCRQRYKLSYDMQVRRIWWCARSLFAPWIVLLIIPCALGIPFWFMPSSASWFLMLSFGLVLLFTAASAVRALIAFSCIVIFLNRPLLYSWTLSGKAVTELRPGIALRFNRGFSGGPFSESIVLITQYGYKSGAVGFIINKALEGHPTGPQWLEDPANFERANSIRSSGSLKDLRLGYGGPVPSVFGDGFEILHRGGQADAVRDAVESGVAGVYVGGRRKDIHTALTSSHQMPAAVAFQAIAVRGYAGWAPAQLDHEIRQGAWTIHNITAALIFGTSRRTLYHAISRIPAEGRWGEPGRHHVSAEDSEL